MFQSKISIFLVIIGLTYQVNCFKNLEANLWVPSFERSNDENSYLNDLKFKKLIESNYKPEIFDTNTDEDGDDSAQYSDDDFATYLNKILESQLDDNSKFKDDLEDAFYDSIGSSEEIQNNERDHESEAHSSLVGGYQFVSGGAGEGNQHLKPNGESPNKLEVKTDADLPAYCEPPNPCPVGYQNDDCDPRPYKEFTAEFSKIYQTKQKCMCDSDHNECSKNAGSNDIQDLINSQFDDHYNSVVAKKSPRMKRSTENNTDKQQKLRIGQRPLYFHVAKKSPHA